VTESSLRALSAATINRGTVSSKVNCSYVNQIFSRRNVTAQWRNERGITFVIFRIFNFSIFYRPFSTRLVRESVQANKRPSGHHEKMTSVSEEANLSIARIVRHLSRHGCAGCGEIVNIIAKMFEKPGSIAERRLTRKSDSRFNKRPAERLRAYENQQRAMFSFNAF